MKNLNLRAENPPRAPAKCLTCTIHIPVWRFLSGRGFRNLPAGRPQRAIRTRHLCFPPPTRKTRRRMGLGPCEGLPRDNHEEASRRRGRRPAATKTGQSRKKCHPRTVPALRGCEKIDSVTEKPRFRHCQRGCFALSGHFFTTSERSPMGGETKNGRNNWLIRFLHTSG